jgi:hypothetical protein
MHSMIIFNLNSRFLGLHRPLHGPLDLHAYIGPWAILAFCRQLKLLLTLWGLLCSPADLVVGDVRA